jgi:transcriptional regulator with XRE-family HTH domain
MNVREILGANVRRLRLERQLSQEALGYLAGIDRSYISEIERGAFSVSLDKIASLAAALKVQPFELLKPSDPFEGDT